MLCVPIADHEPGDTGPDDSDCQCWCAGRTQVQVYRIPGFHRVHWKVQNNFKTLAPDFADFCYKDKFVSQVTTILCL